MKKHHKGGDAALALAVLLVVVALVILIGLRDWRRRVAW